MTYLEKLENARHKLFLALTLAEEGESLLEEDETALKALSARVSELDKRIARVHDPE